MADGVARGLVPENELDFDEDQVFYYRGQPFTGVAVAAEPRGRSEIEYRDGLQNGPSREWDGSGTLRSESFYRDNVCHGVSREFDTSGRLRKETLIEYAIRVSETRYDAAGNIEDQWGIGERDQWYDRLQQRRRELGWPVPGRDDDG